jgi:hypothetical protein
MTDTTTLKPTPILSVKLADEFNYPEWASEAQLYLQYMKLNDIVMGKISRPIENTKATLTQEWDEKSIKFKLVLILSTEKGPRSKIIMCDTAADSWKALKDAYKGITPTCKNLDNSYFSLSLKGRVMVGTMEDSRYAINGKLWTDSGHAINGKLWKVKKRYKQQRITCI